jgi:hypothetical protein
MQEFEPAQVASTPEPIRILSRKEQFEKEVTIARESYECDGSQRTSYVYLTLWRCLCSIGN